MIEPGKTYVVMGLLDAHSIAYAAGRAIRRAGGEVIFTVQNERLQRIFLDRSDNIPPEERAALRIEFCDVTMAGDVPRLFERVGPVAGVVHSIAYANPKTCLGEEFFTGAVDDIKTAFHISCVSLAEVTHCARSRMENGGSIVTLSFESRMAFPYYNWMGVNKAALEALVRGLARRYGRDLLRVNAVSAGPLSTRAAKAIPHFAHLARTWRRQSLLPWDPCEEADQVANAILFLLGPASEKITGQVLHVDGGASVVGGDLLPFEKIQQIEDLSREHGIPLTPP